MTDMSGGNPTERSNMVSNAALLDDLDRQIVHELHRDGRRAFRDIGRHLGVPEATVRSRVRRMQENRSLRIIGTDRKFNRMRPSMARVLGLETRSAKEG